MIHCGPHEGRHTGALVAKKLDEIINTLELPDYGANEKAYAYTHMLHPGQKGTILYQLGIFNQTLQKWLKKKNMLQQKLVWMLQ